MEKKVFCSKINKEVCLIFNLVKAPTLDNPNNCLLGLVSHCSACGTNLCEKGLPAKTLVGQYIDL